MPFFLPCSRALGLVGRGGAGASRRDGARPLAVMASQLLAGLLLDGIGFFGVGSDLCVGGVAGAVLIISGGVLVVRY